MLKLFLATILMLSLVLASCQNFNSNEGDSLADETTSYIMPQESASLQSGDNKDPSGTDSTTYSFDSYNDLIASFSTTKSDDNIIQTEKSMYGKIYQDFVDEMSSADTNIILPYFDGSPMTLRNKEGLSNITLMTQEFVSLPWIWYYGIYNGSDIVIKITYLAMDIPQSYSASQVLKIISSDAVNIHNYQNFSNFKNVYTLDINLMDADTTALVYEYNNSSKKTVSIYYEGFFICIDAQSESFNDTFWSSLSFQ